VLRRVEVEHEADQRPLEARPCSHVDGEARAGELGGAFEIQNPKRLAQFPVRLGGKVPRPLRRVREMRLYHYVVGLGFAGGYFIARKVGNAGEREAELLVELRGGLVEGFELVFE